MNIEKVISKFFEFIVWDNFTSPDILMQLIIGLLSIFMFLFGAVIVSFAVLPRAKESTFRSSTGELVFRAAVGIGLFSFLSTFLLLTQTLYWHIFLIGFHVFMFYGIYRQPKATKQTLMLLKQMFVNHKYLWILFIISAIPSLLPPLWIDEVSYHIAYPLLWVQKGGIYTEESMRYPLYSFGIHSVLTIGIFLKSTTFMHLFSWLCGTLTTLGIWAVLKRLNVWKPLQYVGALAFFFTPVVQQYLNIAYIDVPMMFLTFAAAFALLVLKNNQAEKNIQFATATILALFVAGKPTAAFAIPAIFFIVLYRSKLKQLLPFLITFSVLGSVWYIRNIIINLDPIPPAVNMLLGLEDKFWSVQDYKFIMSDIDIHHNWTWVNIWYKLPWELMVSRADSPLRYWPHLSYVWVFGFSFFVMIKKWHEEQKRIIFLFALFNATVWLGVSYFTRYAHFLPLAAISAILVLNEIYLFVSKKIAISRWVKFAIIGIFFAVMFGPKHLAFSYYKNSFNKKIPITKTEIQAFVGWDTNVALSVIQRFKEFDIPQGSRIYGFPLTSYKYYVINEGYLPIGDGVCKYRWQEFMQNTDSESIKAFLRDAKTEYLFIDKNYMNIGERIDFSTLSGFEVLHDEKNIILLKITNF